MPKLKYVGPRLSTGEPERYLAEQGIPAGDVRSEDLTKDQVAIALKSGLYEWATPPKERAAAKRNAKKQVPAVAIAGDETTNAAGAIDGSSEPPAEETAPAEGEA